jgi:hypothetical protein
MWAGTAAAVVLLAGCQDGGDGPVDLAVTTPAASATAGAPTSAAPGNPGGPTGTAPGSAAPSGDPGGTAPGSAAPSGDPGGTATGGPGPGGTDPGGTDPGGTDPGGTDPGGAGPVQAYAGMVRDWQSARAEFFAAVSAGRPLTVRDQNLLAVRFLAAQRRFGAALRSYPWPAPAAPAVRRLRAENGVQEHFIAGLTTAATAAEFTSGLAAYGVGTAAENRAVAAVTTGLN